MKLFMLLILSSVVSYAQVSRQASVTQITKGSYTVENTIPNCPPNSMCQPVSNLILTVNPSGCLDKAIVSYKVVHSEDPKVKVYVSALNVVNPKSAKVKCAAAPTSTHTIRIGTGYYDEELVDVIFLDNIANIAK